MADKNTDDFKQWLDTLEDLKNDPKKQRAMAAEQAKANKPAKKPRKPVNFGKLGLIFRRVVLAGLVGGSIYGLGAGFAAPHHDATGTVTDVTSETTTCGCGDANGDGKTDTYKIEAEGATIELSESDIGSDKLAKGDKVTVNIHEAGGLFSKHIDGYKGKVSTPKP